MSSFEIAIVPSDQSVPTYLGAVFAPQEPVTRAVDVAAGETKRVDFSVASR